MGRQYAKEQMYKDHGITHDKHGKPYEFKYVTPPTVSTPTSPPPPARKFADNDQLTKISDLVFYAENMKNIHGITKELSTTCSGTVLKNLKNNVVKATSGLLITTSMNKPGAKDGNNYEGLTLPTPLKDHPTGTNDRVCSTVVPTYFTNARIDEYKAVGKSVYNRAVDIIYTVDSSLRVADALTEFCREAGALGVDTTNAYTELCSSFDLDALVLFTN